MTRDDLLRAAKECGGQPRAMAARLGLSMDGLRKRLERTRITNDDMALIRRGIDVDETAALARLSADGGTVTVPLADYTVMRSQAALARDAAAQLDIANRVIATLTRELQGRAA